jgi:hypothetical protein
MVLKCNTCAEDAFVFLAKRVLGLEVSFPESDNDEQIELGGCFIGEAPSCVEGQWKGSDEATFLTDLNKLSINKAYLLRKGTNSGKDTQGNVHDGAGHWQVLYFEQEARVWRLSSQNPDLDPALTQVTEPGFPPTRLSPGGITQLLKKNATWGSQAGQVQYLVFEMNERLIRLGINYIHTVRQAKRAEDGIAMAIEQACEQSLQAEIKFNEGIIVTDLRSPNGFSSSPKPMGDRPNIPAPRVKPTSLGAVDICSTTPTYRGLSALGKPLDPAEKPRGVGEKLKCQQPLEKHPHFLNKAIRALGSLVSAVTSLFSGLYCWLKNLFCSSSPASTLSDESRCSSAVLSKKKTSSPSAPMAGPSRFFKSSKLSSQPTAHHCDKRPRN